MSTKVYGASDDLIEFEGCIQGELDALESSDENPCLLFFSDGTVLEAQFGKNERSIWGIRLRHQGGLFIRIDPCDDEDAKPYSDIAHFQTGLKWAYIATEYERA